MAVALEATAAVLEHQVLLDSRGEIEVRVRSLGSLDAARAAAALRSLFGRPVSVAPADRLERWPSGKVRPVVRAEGAS